MISQLARAAFSGRGLLYLATIGATTLILVMAANTAYAGFPRLAALQAGDGYLPRQLTYRGSRLVYSRGIVVLAIVASLLIMVFDASVTALIPLYAIGVFLSFTLSQLGMARRWWKSGRLAAGPGDPGGGLGPAPRPALASQDGRERAGGADHRRRDRDLRGHQVPRRGLGGDPRDPGAGDGLLLDPPALPRARAAALARRLRPAGARRPPPRDPADQRRPPRDGAGAALRARPLGGRHGALRVDRPRADGGGAEEVGAVGRRRAGSWC